MTFRLCQNLDAFKDYMAMKYEKEICGSIEALSNACETTCVYSFNDVTT